VATTETSLVNLQIISVLQQKIGDCFPPGKNSRSFNREELYAILFGAVKSSLEIYQKYYKQGVRKMLADVRLRTAVALSEDHVKNSHNG
jgi:hypothetical protein